MTRVEGIGGVFIDSNDAAALAGWYQDILGIDLNAHPDGSGYYRVFYTRDPEHSFLRENPVFAINQAQQPLAATGRGFTLNLRVDNLVEYLAVIRRRGAEVEERIMEWERGKHAWVRDLDGNRIELYEEILVPGRH